jgi:hypothetical protein
MNLLNKLPNSLISVAFATVCLCITGTGLYLFRRYTKMELSKETREVTGVIFGRAVTVLFSYFFFVMPPRAITYSLLGLLSLFH